MAVTFSTHVTPVGAPTDYPYTKAFTCVLIVVCLLVIQYAITMYFFTMAARIKVFTKEFMDQFKQLHCVAFPQRPDTPQWGYPDSGNGYFGKRLSYEHWYIMNNG